MDINDWLKKLFTSSENKGEPLVTESISRSDKYKGKAALIETLPEWQRFVRDVHQMASNQQPKMGHRGVEAGFYSSTQTKGFYLTQIEEFDNEWFQVLIDHMLQNLKEEAYMVTRHVAEYSEVKQNPVCWEKSYAKIKPSFVDHKQQQGFGNVQVELKMLDERPKLFKLQTNYYSGFNYEDPKDYSALLDTLFAIRS